MNDMRWGRHIPIYDVFNPTTGRQLEYWIVDDQGPWLNTKAWEDLGEAVKATTGQRLDYSLAPARLEQVQPGIQRRFYRMSFAALAALVEAAAIHPDLAIGGDTVASIIITKLVEIFPAEQIEVRRQEPEPVAVKASKSERRRSTKGRKRGQQ